MKSLPLLMLAVWSPEQAYERNETKKLFSKGNWIIHYNMDRPHLTFDGQKPHGVYVKSNFIGERGL